MGVGVRVLQEKGYGTRRFQVKEGFVSEAERLVDIQCLMMMTNIAWQ